MILQAEMFPWHHLRFCHSVSHGYYIGLCNKKGQDFLAPTRSILNFLSVSVNLFALFRVIRILHFNIIQPCRSEHNHHHRSADKPCNKNNRVKYHVYP